MILRYEGEDDQSFFVTDADGARLSIPKNRAVPEPFPAKSSPLAPVFRLLLWAFIGLAPAGLGALILSPLAALWAILLWITRPLTRGDRKRVLVILGTAAILFAVAVPLSKLFLDSLP
jgi:hypothetical protein